MSLDHHCNKFDVSECSRCKKDLSSIFGRRGGFTAGYYEVKDGQWSAFANPGERYLCDNCMYKDPRYIAVYGVQS